MENGRPTVGVGAIDSRRHNSEPAPERRSKHDQDDTHRACPCSHRSRDAVRRCHGSDTSTGGKHGLGLERRGDQPCRHRGAVDVPRFVGHICHAPRGMGSGIHRLFDGPLPRLGPHHKRRPRLDPAARPPTTINPDPGSPEATDGVSSVRFANSHDGWVFGPELWATHDGGRTWHEVSVYGARTGVVVALEGRAWHRTRGAL